ncbi:hypothetical protein FRC04_006082 [Tulasnella sp. 424]|nr:hypothetical protein FRC04_006082 [Tulasnella sp. 424]
MPKAGSSRSASPEKGSPTKRSHRKHVRGSFALPIGSATSSLPTFPRPADYQTDQHEGHLGSRRNILLLDNLHIGSSSSAENDATAGGSLWLPEDVFLGTNTSCAALPASSPLLMLPENNSTEEMEDPGDIADVETALDDAVVTSGLTISQSYSLPKPQPASLFDVQTMSTAPSIPSLKPVDPVIFAVFNASAGEFSAHAA